MKRFFAYTVFVFLIGCTNAEEPMDVNKDELISTLIIGSAESPDPILKRIKELEQNGKIEDVQILESFPVQIHLKAQKDIIDELNNMPRIKGGLH